MERKYREVTIKRKKQSLKALSICTALILCLLGFFAMPKEFKKDVFLRGGEWVRPVIFKFEEEYYESQPTFLSLLLPGVFGYLEKERGLTMVVEGITVTPSENAGELHEEERSFGQNKQAYDGQKPTEERDFGQKLHIELGAEAELMLLQENLYEESRITKKVPASEQENSGPILSPGELIEHLKEAEESEAAVNSDASSLIWGYDKSAYTDMAELIKEFYIVDASTSPDANLLDIEKLTAFDCSIEKGGEGPQILIYHSHSQEGFADSVPGDKRTTIVGAGDYLAGLLQEMYGYQVLHYEAVYDLPSRDDAYSKALPDIERVLEENPSIEVVIDLHRDAVAEDRKLVTTIDGKDYARFMFFNGICRGTKGPITYLNNPYLQENLAFSFQSQMVAEHFFPGITRKIYLKAWRYNMQLKPKNMLIELGAQTNTVEEIMNTTEIIAFIIDKVLSGQ